MNESSLGRVVVAQVRAHPLLDLLDRHALARGVVLHLVALHAADAEVAAVGMCEIQSADGGRRKHGAALGQRHANGCLGAEKVEQCPFLGVIRASRIPGRGADSPVALLDELLVVQILPRRVAPELAPNALVQAFGEGFSQATQAILATAGPTLAGLLAMLPL